MKSPILSRLWPSTPASCMQAGCKRLYKPGRHGHMLSHVCMLAAQDTQLIPCCSDPMLPWVARDHMESPGDLRLCMALCMFHMFMATYEPMLACCPLARCFHGRMGTCTQGIARVQLFARVDP